MYVSNRILLSYNFSGESREPGCARANPGFHLFPELIYGGRRISGLPHVEPRKWLVCVLAFSLPRHALSFSCGAPAHTRHCIHTESCDLDSNFCEAPTKLLLSWLSEMYSFSYDYHFFRAKYFRTHVYTL